MSKFSYVTVNIQSHGYMVRTNEGYEFDGVKFSAGYIGEDLIVCSYSNETHHPNNVRIRLDEIGKLVWDRRNSGTGNYVLVYRPDRPKTRSFSCCDHSYARCCGRTSRLTNNW